MSSETNQPRLYQRGHDKIDLDEYIRLAESGFGSWLQFSGLKEERRREVQDAFANMLEGISNGNYTYKVGGGFDNTSGVTNTSKGFDAYGLVAGYLGNLLRRLSVYSPKEETAEEDASKISWNGKDSMSQYVLRSIFNGDNGNIRDFIDLDPYNSETKTRSTAKRTEILKGILDYLSPADLGGQGGFDTIFTKYTDADKQKQLSYIELARKALEDGIVSDDEWLSLANATGITNIRDMFTTGAYLSPLKASQQTALGTEQDFLNWLALNYPNKNFESKKLSSLRSTERYTAEAINSLKNYIKSLDEDHLWAAVYSTFGEGKDINNWYDFKKYYSNNPGYKFSSQFVLNTIFNHLFLDKNPDKYNTGGGNKYYIPKTYSKERGSGLVWNAENDDIEEVNIYDIPYLTDYMQKEYLSQYPSHKEGGKILKFDRGGGISNTTVTNDWDNIIFGSDVYKDIIGKLTLKDIQEVNRYLNRFGVLRQARYKSGLLETPSNDDVKALQTNFNNLFGKLNSEVILGAINNNIITTSGTTGDNSKGDWADGYFGNITNLRHLGDNVNLLGAINELLKGKGIEAFINKDTGMVNFRPLAISLGEGYTPTNTEVQLEGVEPLKESPADLEKGLNLPESSDDNVIDPNPNSTIFGTGRKDTVFEDYFNLPTESIGKPNFWAEAIPDLLGASRLGLSLNANKKVWQTMNKAINPIFKSTYEKYSPVTGAFSENLAYNSSASNIESMAGKAKTSDADRELLRELEGKLQAEKLRVQGSIADDNEIKRTKAEALAKMEDNAARRIEDANFNMASINQANRERALLKAEEIKANWGSIDQYLGGIEARTRQRMLDNRDKINTMSDEVIKGRAQLWLTELMATMEADKNRWLKENEENGERKSIIEWPEYQNYLRISLLLLNMHNAMIRSDLSRRYGLGYVNPYIVNDKDRNFNMYNAGNLWNERYNLNLFGDNSR